MTDEGIALEFEATLCAEGATKNTCPSCGLETFRKHCPICPPGKDALELTGDALVDKLFADIAAGKEVDLEQLRGKKTEPPPAEDEFEVVEPGSPL